MRLLMIMTDETMFLLDLVLFTWFGELGMLDCGLAIGSHLPMCWSQEYSICVLPRGGIWLLLPLGRNPIGQGRKQPCH